MSAAPGTHLVVDGSNIATEGRSVPSLMQLDEAVRAFIEEFPHDHWTVVVDATFEHRIDSSEQKAYDEALAAGELLTPPAGTIGRGDRFILQIANRVGATVFSNDSFQEFHAEYPWLFDEGRLIGGKPVPGVGWIFAPRSPVRGAKSRMVTRAAKKAAKKAAPSPSAPEQPPAPRRGRKKKAATASPAASGPMPVPKAPPPGPPPRRRRGQAEAEPVNEGLAFVEFISEHPIGSRVDGEVVAFTSHGAQIAVGSVRCYVPLRSLADPAPRAAREVLSKGEVRTFAVQALDAPRRGIDLALPGFEQLEAMPPELAPAPAAGEDAPAPRRRRTRTRPEPADQTVGARGADVAPLAADQASADAEASLPESEAALPPKKTTTRKKATAKKAPAKRTTAKKAPAKRTTAKRATTAKRSTAKRTSTAKKAPAKRTAKKATAKKTTARKSTAKKAPAKRTTKKATAKKATARKSTARKTTARKTTARKSR
jgi:hypothetical protein